MSGHVTDHRPFPAALWQAALIILLGSVIGMAANGMRGDGIPLVGSVRVVKFDKPVPGAVEQAAQEPEERVPAAAAPQAAEPAAEKLPPVAVESVPAEELENGGISGVEVFSPLPAVETPVQEEEGGPLALDLSQALELHEGGQAVFVDARMPHEFAAGHIPGAFNLPYDDLESHLDVLNYLPENGLVIAYCDGSECELSLELADELTAMGFGQVRVFFGGWEAWSAAGYPTEEGEAVLPY